MQAEVPRLLKQPKRRKKLRGCCIVNPPPSARSWRGAETSEAENGRCGRPVCGQETERAANKQGLKKLSQLVGSVCAPILSTRMHRSRGWAIRKNPLMAPTGDSRVALVSVARKGRNAHKLMGTASQYWVYGRMVGLTGKKDAPRNWLNRVGLAYLGWLALARSFGVCRALTGSKCFNQSG